MTGRFLFVFIGLSCFWACDTEKPFVQWQGKTMGTYYHVTFQPSSDLSLVQSEIDSLLNSFEDELSTYRPSSTISNWNASDTGFCLPTDAPLSRAVQLAYALYEETNGYLDGGIAPIINYYGFGPDRRPRPDTVKQSDLDSLLEYASFSKMQFSEKAGQWCMKKNHPLQQLDLNATAKGQGVDEVVLYLTSKGIQNAMVEIGGEVRTVGHNPKGLPWTIGINKPDKSASETEILLPVSLKNQAMATSGNYRNFFQNGTINYVHIIHPKTGISKPTDVLSASVLSTECGMADGLATALMVMGLDSAKVFLKTHSQWPACLIYHDIEADTLAYYFANNFQIQK